MRPRLVMARASGERCRRRLESTPAFSTWQSVYGPRSGLAWCRRTSSTAAKVDFGWLELSPLIRRSGGRTLTGFMTPATSLGLTLEGGN
jgi:hypothetical protein